MRPGFEGGQMPLHRRLPKRGFTNISKKVISVVNLNALDRFEAGSTVDIRALREAGLVKGKIDGVKILGTGEIKKSLLLKDCLVSKSARAKIESAGGNIEL